MKIYSSIQTINPQLQSNKSENSKNVNYSCKLGSQNYDTVMFGKRSVVLEDLRSFFKRGYFPEVRSLKPYERENDDYAIVARKVICGIKEKNVYPFEFKRLFTYHVAFIEKQKLANVKQAVKEESAKQNDITIFERIWPSE